MESARIYGEFRHTVDAKKRLALPAKIRDNMSETMILVGSIFSSCIALYPLNEWEKFEKKLEALSETDGILARRKIYSRLCEVTCDAHGRIVIPQNLYDYAHLQRDVVIIGVGSFAEIWDSELWANEQIEEDKPEIIDILRKANF